MEDSGEEDDRKMPAIERLDGDASGHSDHGSAPEEDESGNEEKDDQDISDEEHSDDESSDEESEEERELLGPDGHILSSYERMRIERIKRNQAYLASLGLDQQRAEIERQKQEYREEKRARRREQTQVIEKRERISRSTKKNVNYAVMIPRWASADGTVEPPKKPRGKPGPRKNRDRENRLDVNIYKEFKRLDSQKRLNLKAMEIASRKAQVELRHAEKRFGIWERKRQREEITTRIMQKLRLERSRYGGSTLKDTLGQIEKRTPEIMAAIRQYDATYTSPEKFAETERQKRLAEQKIQLVDAMDQFPRAMKNAVSDLNFLLLERAPKDPPPPRRNRKRGVAAPVEPEATNSNLKAVPAESVKSKSPTGEWGSLAASIAVENMKTPTLVQSNDLKDPPGVDKKPKAVKAKNVGGWVSPQFAGQIDRRWLDRDKAQLKFDLDSYVPQIGDIVLYYPTGHREFLKKHPDILGKVNRTITRQPLWERARKEKAKLTKKAKKGELEDGNGKKSGSKGQLPWWNDEWYENVGGRLGDYPLICKVEKTQVEFPSDPHADHKVVQKDDNSGEVQLVWTVPKAGKGKKGGQKVKPPLCLSIMLKPLTPLLPPRWDDDASKAVEHADLSPPPSFQAIVFPSFSSCPPFIIPFSWGYRLGHSLTVGDKAKVAAAPDVKGTVREFFGVPNYIESIELEHKVDNIAELFTQLKHSGNPTASVLQSALNTNSQQNLTDNLASLLPLSDACLVVEQLAGFMDSKKSPAEVSNAKPAVADAPMSYIIRTTLPLWNGIGIVRTGDARRIRASSWQLTPVSAALKAKVKSPFSDLATGIIAEDGLTYSIDDALRTKLEFKLDEFVKSHDNASIFQNVVTEDIAPSYSCAVPINMSFSKIIKRLTVSGKSRKCFYRSVDSLLGDLTMIMDNCLLYNSPDSFVCKQAIEIIPSAKSLLSGVSTDHTKEKVARERADEERRKVVQSLSAPSVTEKGNSAKQSKKSSTKLDSYMGPFTEVLDRSWLERVQPSGPVDTLWVPQTGDTILYSRSKHAKFVEGHLDSLTTPQVMIPKFHQKSPDDVGMDEASQALGREMEGNWIVGNVVWIRAVFPRALKKHTSDVASSFPVQTPLLALGVCFKDYDTIAPEQTFTLYWRPCRVNKEKTPVRVGKRRGTRSSDIQDSEQPATFCESCGCNFMASFVSPATRATRVGDDGNFQFDGDKVLLAKGTALQCRQATVLSSNHADAIDRCLTEVKRRILSKVSPDQLDPKLTVSNIKHGFVPTAKKGKAPGSFESLLGMETIETERSPSKRKTAKERKWENKEHLEESSHLLSEVHFLPPFSTLPTKVTSGKTVASSRKAKTIVRPYEQVMCPVPMLCLELIQMRLRNGYYRSKPALLDDVQEAYVNSCLLVLSKPASRKFDAISVHRVAKGLKALKPPKKSMVNNSRLESAGTTPAKALSDEEISWVEKLDKVRRLYSTVLVCIGETVHVERLFGIAPKKIQTKEPHPVQFTPTERETRFKRAREKLGLLMNAIGRDLCTNRKDKAGVLVPTTHLPVFKLKLVSAAGTLVTDDDLSDIKDELNLEAGDESATSSVAQFSDSNVAFESGAIKAAEKKELTYALMNKGNEDILGNPEAKVAAMVSSEVTAAERTSKTSDPASEKTAWFKRMERLPPPPVVVDSADALFFRGPDYSANSPLAQLLFGKPKRTNTCARCKVYGRSMVSCRVQRGHSNPDFDFKTIFEEKGALDGLLYMLRTGDEPPPEIVEAMKEKTADIGSGAMSVGEQDNDQDDECEKDAQDRDSEGKGKIDPDPEATLKKARSAVALAQLLLKRAQEESRSETRLGEDFIQSYFPIDPSDGKYTFCVVCGLTGDVMCCETDGCPVVSHPKCVGLQEAPEDNWYCTKCSKKDSHEEGKKPAPPNVQEEDGSSDSAIPAGESLDVPAHDQDFDEMVENLYSLLSELRGKRDVRPRKPRDRKRKEIDSDQGEQPVRKRGRPRKNPQQSRPESGPFPDAAPSRHRRQHRNASRESSVVYYDDMSDFESDYEEKNRNVLDTMAGPEKWRIPITVGTAVIKKIRGGATLSGSVKSLPTKEAPFYVVSYDDEDRDDEELSKREILKMTALASEKNERKSGGSRTPTTSGRPKNIEGLVKGIEEGNNYDVHWNDMFYHLQLFGNENGHLNPPKDFDVKLYNWTQNQYYFYRNVERNAEPALTRVRYKKLKEIDFVGGYVGGQGRERSVNSKKRKRGLIRRDETEDSQSDPSPLKKKRGAPKKRVGIEIKSRKIAPPKEIIEFDMDRLVHGIKETGAADRHWNNMFYHLQVFEQENGHFFPPKNQDGKLHNWARNQQYFYLNVERKRTPKLSTVRYNKLREIDFLKGFEAGQQRKRGPQSPADAKDDKQKVKDQGTDDEEDVRETPRRRSNRTKNAKSPSSQSPTRRTRRSERITTREYTNAKQSTATEESSDVDDSGQRSESSPRSPKASRHSKRDGQRPRTASRSETAESKSEDEETEGGDKVRKLSPRRNRRRTNRYTF